MIALALGFLYPQATPLRDYVVADDGTGARLVAWNLPTPRPTDKEIQDAIPAALAQAQAKRDMTDAQAQLDERYRMFNRATASGNAEDAAEIQAEIADILAYLKELRNAS